MLIYCRMSAMALALLATPVLAADEPAKLPILTANADSKAVVAFPDILETTLSVEGDLADEAIPQTTLTSTTPQVSPWQAWKNRVRDKTGITFGGPYGILWQHYSASRFGDENAVGSKFAFNASADLTNRGAPNALKFDIAVEDRRALGTEFPPLSSAIGRMIAGRCRSSTTDRRSPASAGNWCRSAGAFAIMSSATRHRPRASRRALR